MARNRVEKRLRDVARRLTTVREDLGVAEQALIQLEGEVDDARIRSLVSETPIAQREHDQVRRQAEMQRRNRDQLRAELAKLERRQDELLDAYNQA